MKSRTASALATTLLALGFLAGITPAWGRGPSARLDQPGHRLPRGRRLGFLCQRHLDGIRRRPDIWGTGDQFNFLYQNPTNNVIVAEVAAVEDTDSWAKAGVMTRDDRRPARCLPTWSSRLETGSTSSGGTARTGSALTGRSPASPPPSGSSSCSGWRLYRLLQR